MLHLMVAAGLKDVVEAYYVALYVGIRIGNTVPNPSLRRKVHHHGRRILHEKPLHESFVGDASLLENEASALRKTLEPRILYSYIVIIGNRVDANHSDALKCSAQPFGQSPADKAGSTGNENGLAVQNNIVIQHTNSLKEKSGKSVAGLP